MAITAKIIKDSISEENQRIITFELEYPRFIHSEFMTHRAVSKNSASSRAIPLATMLKNVWNNGATFVEWGKNQSGMQAKEQLQGLQRYAAEAIWNLSGKAACIFAWLLGKTGAHKQICNRVVEPWSHMKVVATATEWDNFFHLRNHKDAQPEIHELARVMWEAVKNSIPTKLRQGQWHLPYVDGYNIKPNEDFVPFDEKDIGLDDAIKLSASLCAQVSYRKSDESIKKALIIYDRLVSSTPVHASPFEHQATPASHRIVRSGNFVGWIQYRQTIPNNVCKKYVESN